jgi:hypothetical protein
MENLASILSHLPERHRVALEWFVANAGANVSWPAPVRAPQGDTLIATKAKGIYKPNWMDYALSVRQTLGSPYADREPVTRADGTWVYAYYQENPDPASRDTEYTNIGLMQCMRDRVPVGVMRQVRPKPFVRYQVLGLALVSGWDGGYFFLEGFSPAGHAQSRGPQTELELVTSPRAWPATEDSNFDPSTLVDARARIMGLITRRRGQAAFRHALIRVYEGRCAITGCDAIDALEAAHIVPYLGPETDRVDNGLLLRADLHTIFDLGLIAVHEGSLAVIVGQQLLGTVYGALEGTTLRIPVGGSDRPSVAALAAHREWSGL